jgi:hypothetical protein
MTNLIISGSFVGAVTPNWVNGERPLDEVSALSSHVIDFEYEKEFIELWGMGRASWHHSMSQPSE